MTSPEAIATLRLAGTVCVSSDGVIVRLPKRRPVQVEEALTTLRRRSSEAISLLSPHSKATTIKASPNPKEVDLYWNSRDRSLWLAADEDDAQLLGERRESVDAADEIRLIISIDDPAVLRDIHAFKNEFRIRPRPGHDEGGSKTLP
jgi:hypothetical protein